MQVSFKQRPQAARATTKSSDMTRMMYTSRAVPMAARIPVVVSIEVADGRSGSALYSGLYGRLERVKGRAHAPVETSRLPGQSPFQHGLLLPSPPASLWPPAAERRLEAAILIQDSSLAAPLWW
jgi:hypothetical protein